MKPDLSLILYERYSQLSNKNMELTLSNGRKLSGIIIGFFLGEENSNDSNICRWHIAKEKHKMLLGIDQFGFLIGEIIDHKDILKIHFLEDNSILHFNTK